MMICRKCGKELRRLMLLCLMADFGCQVYPSPSECVCGGDHEFEEAGNQPPLPVEEDR